MKRGASVKIGKLDFGLAALFVLSVGFVYATQISTTTQGDFNNGTFADVFYNSSGFIQLNISESKSSGNYTSKVFDAGGTNTKWNNISWVASAIGELPGNSQVETAPSGINMTGNVLLFHFNNASAYGESASVVYDFSGTGNNGTPIADAKVNLSNSKLGVGGYEFDGTGDYVNMSVTDSLNLNWNYTICAWVYPRDLSVSRYVIKRGIDSNLLKNQQYDLHLGNNGAIILWVGDGTSAQTLSSDAGIVLTDTWSHVCAKVDETNYRHLFFNGYESGTAVEKTVTWAITPTVQFVGVVTSAGTSPFLGTIDELSVWNRSLSDTEILNLYKRGLTHFNVTVRSCDDVNCSDDAWNETYTSSPATLSVSNNSFFQYQANFLTENLSFTPEFYNATLAFSGEPSLPNFTSTEILGRPTNNSIVVNLINGNDTVDAYVEYGDTSGAYGSYAHSTDVSTNVENKSLIELTLTGLEPDTKYYYRVRAKRSTAELYGYSNEHNFTTRRSSYPFNFTMVSDSHMNTVTSTNSVLFRKILGNMSKNDNSDFILHLGDNIQYSTLQAFPNESLAATYYELYRNDIAATHSSIPSFFAIGNWEGEAGWLGENNSNGLNVRKKYIPNPTSSTYAEGGSSDENYYAFTWGDSLFVVLDVMSYTSVYPFYSGDVTDWTLGTEQLGWLNQTLMNSNETWKFLLIHHAVGGNSGNWTDPVLNTPGIALYGRGGGEAAFVGEQATVQRMMEDNGVQAFFYGHDHDAEDHSVNNVHYLQVWASGYGGSQGGRVRVEIISDELARAYFINDSEITVGNVTLDAIAPRVLISELTNTTQLNNGNLTINYNVSDASPISNCILIVNGETNQTNYTVMRDTTQNFTFIDIAPGTYNYTINCTENMTNNFTSDYYGARGNTGNSTWKTFGVIGSSGWAGSSTNLSAQSNLSNVSHLTFEEPTYGKINFTDDADLSSGGDLDLYVNVSFNRIEINTTMLPTLNKSAVLTLYGLTFTDPRILRNGAVCPSSICAEINYTADGNFTFNVTSFSIYAAEETPAAETAATETTSPGSGLPSYSVTESQLENGYEKSLPRGASLKFSLGSELHTLKIESVSKDSVKMTLSSEPVTFTLMINETRKFDLDENGFYDLKISLKGVIIYLAKIELIRINEKINLWQEEDGEQDVSGGKENENPFVDNRSMNIWIIVLIILTAVLFVLWFFMRRKKRYPFGKYR